jgi:hypothetical protein
LNIKLWKRKIEIEINDKRREVVREKWEEREEKS